MAPATLAFSFPLGAPRPTNLCNKTEVLASRMFWAIRSPTQCQPPLCLKSGVRDCIWFCRQICISAQKELVYATWYPLLSLGLPKCEGRRFLVLSSFVIPGFRKNPHEPFPLWALLAIMGLFCLCLLEARLVENASIREVSSDNGHLTGIHSLLSLPFGWPWNLFSNTLNALLWGSADRSRDKSYSNLICHWERINCHSLVCTTFAPVICLK